MLLLKQIFLKELRTYLRKPSLYIIIAISSLYLGLNYFYSMSRFALLSQQLQSTGGLSFVEALLMPHITNVNLFLFFICPFLIVMMFSSEVKDNTYELLLSSPVESWQIVAGKILSSTTIVWFIVLLSLIYPLVTGFYMNIYWAELLVPYIGVLLVSLVYVSVAAFASSLSSSILLSGMLSVSINLGLWLFSIAKDIVDAESWKNFINHLWVGSHFSLFLQSQVKLSSVVFLLSLVLLFSYLSQQLVESRRWR